MILYLLNNSQWCLFSKLIAQMCADIRWMPIFMGYFNTCAGKSEKQSLTTNHNTRLLSVDHFLTMIFLPKGVAPLIGSLIEITDIQSFCICSFYVHIIITFQSNEGNIHEKTFKRKSHKIMFTKCNLWHHCKCCIHRKLQFSGCLHIDWVLFVWVLVCSRYTCR